MRELPDTQPSCFVCDGVLTALASSLNLEHMASFSRTWICDSCGARYSENVEVEQTPATEKEATEASTQDPDESQSGTETVDSSSEPEWQSTGEWREFDTDGDSDSDWGVDWDEDRLAEARERRKQAETEEAERKRRVLDTAEEMSVDWHAPFGTLLDQTDQFVVAKTLYKNRFVLLNDRTGDLIDEVELVRDQTETSGDDREEWDSETIPDDIELHPSGTLELDTRPGWDPDAGVHWCVGPDAMYTFDDRGVSRHPGSDAGSSWSIDVSTDGSTEEPRCCAFLDGVLVIATTDVLCAIQASSGEISWRHELCGGDGDDFQLLLYPDTLYLSEGSKLVALDFDSGVENWTRELGDPRREQTVTQFGSIEGDVLLTVEKSDTEYVCGYDVASGEQQWAFQDRRRLSILRTQDGAVYVDGSDGVVLCLDAATGVLRWQHQLEKLVMDNAKSRARPDRGRIDYLTVTDHGVVTSNWSGTVYLLDLETGDRQWRNFPGGELPSDTGPRAACRVVDDAVVRIKDTQVEAFDLSSGEEWWSFETEEMVPTDTAWGEPVVEDDLLYFTDYDGTLYEVGSEANGLQRLYHPEDDGRRSFAVDAEHVYMASLEPSADIPAYRKAQEAGTDSTNAKDFADSLLDLYALLR